MDRQVTKRNERWVGLLRCVTVAYICRLLDGQRQVVSDLAHRSQGARNGSPLCEGLAEVLIYTGRSDVFDAVKRNLWAEGLYKTGYAYIGRELSMYHSRDLIEGLRPSGVGTESLEL